MSTNGMTNWAVDLKDVGAIYPFQGYEVIMVIILVIIWLGWHVIQLRQEQEQIDHTVAGDPRGDRAREAIDRY